MCGITGFFKLNEMSISSAKSILNPMNDSLQHRGPDASSIFVDMDSNLLMGHRRLSILDTSNDGLQPMHSHSGNLVIAYNGEIYNHNELRSELEQKDDSIRWNGSSDTETLLEAFEQWGIENTLTKLRGMFAIALWDKTEKNFYLIRDRFGEKPLYYGWIEDGQNTIFGFGSELKALRKYPSFSNKISQQALLQYFSYMYVPCPLSIFDGVFKLEPGTILKISSQPPKIKMQGIPHSISGQVFSHDSMTIARWYDFKEVVNTASQNLFRDYDEAS